MKAAAINVLQPIHRAHPTLRFTAVMILLHLPCEGYAAIANELGIHPDTSKAALERLHRVGLVQSKRLPNRRDGHRGNVAQFRFELTDHGREILK